MATEFSKPEYPKILTSADWDKKKGVIAKIHGETGLGKKMDAVKKLYDAVDWDALNMKNHWMGWGDVTLDKWNAVAAKAKSEMTGNLTKLSKTLYELRDLAKETAAKFKKSKTIPSSSTKHVEQIATTADQTGVAWNKNSVGSVLEKMYNEYIEHVYDKFVNTFYTGTKKYVAKHKSTIPNLKSNPTAANFNQNGRDCARDLATGCGNIEKVAKKGFVAKNPQAAGKLFKLLTVWANTQAGTFEQDATREEVLAEVAKLEKVYKAVETLAASF